MNHPLLQKVERIRRRAKLLAVLRAGANVVCCVLGVGLLVGIVDYLARVEDSGTRWLFTLSWLAVIGASVWFFLRPVLQSKWSDQTIAQWIERRFPSLANRLSSSLAFLQAGESLGSKPLMRSVINQTTTEVSDLDLDSALDYRPTFNRVGSAVGLLAVCGILFATNAAMCGKAVTRLLLPFQTSPWPRINHLAFVDPPEKVARGGELRLAVVDEAEKLPSHVDLEVWYDGDAKSEIDVIPMQRVAVNKGGRAGESEKQTLSQMVFERNNVRRSFRYRATGGDDRSMQWRDLQVVEAPQITSGKMRLAPPKYTGWESSEVDEAAGGLRVLEGTEVQLFGASDRPLREAKLIVGRMQTAEASPEADQSPTEFAARIDSDGFRYEVPNVSAEPWVVNESTEYSLSLTDRDGTRTVNADRWNVRAIRDQPPNVRLLEPSGEDPVTPRAKISILGQAEDDLAIRSIELRYQRTDMSDRGEQSVSLLAGPPELALGPMPKQVPPPRQTKDVRYEWSLQPLRVAPGAVISFYLWGEDYKRQSNQTLSRRLVVVSESDLLNRVGRRQSMVLSRLQQRLQQQRQAEENVSAVESLLRETNVVTKAAMDRLQTGVSTQRQVNSALADEDADVAKELDRLRATLDRSQIGDVDVRQRVESTISALQELAKTDLQPAYRGAVKARQILQAERDQQRSDAASNTSELAEVDSAEDVSSEIASQAREELSKAVSRQRAAISKMEELLDDLSAWDNYRSFAQELSDLLRQQRDVQRQTNDVAKKAFSRSDTEPDGKSRADLRNAAARQLELARRADRVMENLSKAESSLEEKDPSSAAMVREAIQRARDGAVSGKMREAGRQIGQSQLGKASQWQDQANETLKEMLDELSQRSLSPEERVEEMDDAGRELQRLQKRQAELTEEFAKAANEKDEAKKRRELQRLQKRQAEIAKEVRKLERQLQRLRAQRSSQQAGQAAESADGAGQAAKQGDAQQAEQLSQLTEAQMEQAQQSLQQQKEQARSELAREQAERLPQMIEALVAQQQSVVDEIKRLDSLRREAGELTKGQEASIAVNAEAQRTVAQDTGLVAKQMNQLPVFVFALDEVQQRMLTVADDLEGLDTSESVEKLAKRCVDELDLIRAMLEKDQASQQNQQQEDGGQGGEGDEKDQANGGEQIDPRLAQLKLLRGMQVSINEETKQLNAVTGEDAPARRWITEEQQSLAARQGQLGEVMEEMFQQAVAQLDAPNPNERESNDAEDETGEGATGEEEVDALLDALDQELDLLLQ